MKNFESMSKIPEIAIAPAETAEVIETQEMKLKECAQMDAKEVLTPSELKRYKELRDELGDTYKTDMYLPDKEKTKRVDADDKETLIATQGEKVLTAEQRRILTKESITPKDMEQLSVSGEKTALQEIETIVSPGERLIALSLERSYESDEIQKIMDAIETAFLRKGEDMHQAFAMIDNFEVDDKDTLIKSLQITQQEIPRNFVETYLKIMNA
jgi:hypothetical protein